MDKKSRVIIVEGKRLAALALKQLLEEQGFVIALAHDGEAALERVRREPFDVILMDIDLGTGMDGIETARALQEKCSTPVVFVSSSTDPHTVAEA
ncbi:MAG: response regulator, partial [Spirochaetia bacterium]